jgi:hypothetical protein
MARLLPSFAAICLVVSGLSGVAGAREHAPDDTVRSFFRALERHDYALARALTVGAAEARLRWWLDNLESEAQANHAELRLHVRSLDISSQSAGDGGDPVPVDVNYSIDVVGRRGWFQRVARRLSGQLRFLVSSAEPTRIESIEGGIE